MIINIYNCGIEMINTKLIMMEGLPSTGKTTNSQFLQIQLERNENNVKWIHEVAHPHPTIFLADKFSLDKSSKEITLSKWREFSTKILSIKNEVYILDSAFFQFQIFWFLLNNALYTDLNNFINKLLEMIKSLNPCLIYLYREDTEKTINYLENERGTHDLEKIWNRDKLMPYYQNKPTGSEGFKHFLRDYSHIAKLLFDTSLCKKLSIEISEGDWNNYEDKLLSFLTLSVCQVHIFFLLMVFLKIKHMILS